jgi:hypothetical protein
MTIRWWGPLAVAGAVMAAGAPSGGGAQPAPAAPREGALAPAEVAVPEGDGAPVVTDGIFSPGEWDDARRLALSEAVELRLKQYRGVVFVGVHRLGSASIGPSELCLAEPGGPVHKLHVSAQLGEVVVPPEGDPPPFRFGHTPGWYANELRRDMDEAERLQKVGKSPLEIIAATSYPTDGIEFAIRRSKLPGPRWRIRLGVSVLADGKPGWLVHPAGTTEKTTEGWQVLRLE